MPSKRYQMATNTYPKPQAALIMQLRTGHIALNKHLYAIGKSNTLECPYCNKGKTPQHILMNCPRYTHQRHKLRNELGRRANNFTYLLNSTDAVNPVVQFINNSRRLQSTHGMITTTD